MSDELEEAVKRVRKCQADGPDAAYPNAKGGEFHEDCLTITDAYLAESAELARLRAKNDLLREVSEGLYVSGFAVLRSRCTTPSSTPAPEAATEPPPNPPAPTDPATA